MPLSDNIKYGFEHGQYKFSKSVTIIDSKGSEKVFTSYSKADKYLNRYKGYISRCINLNIFDISDGHGIKYSIK